MWQTQIRPFANSRNRHRSISRLRYCTSDMQLSELSCLSVTVRKLYNFYALYKTMDDGMSKRPWIHVFSLIRRKTISRRYGIVFDECIRRIRNASRIPNGRFIRHTTLCFHSSRFQILIMLTRAYTMFYLTNILDSVTFHYTCMVNLYSFAGSLSRVPPTKVGSSLDLDDVIRPIIA